MKNTNIDSIVPTRSTANHLPSSTPQKCVHYCPKFHTHTSNLAVILPDQFPRPQILAPRYPRNGAHISYTYTPSPRVHADLLLPPAAARWIQANFSLQREPPRLFPPLCDLALATVYVFTRAFSVLLLQKQREREREPEPGAQGEDTASRPRGHASARARARFAEPTVGAAACCVSLSRALSRSRGIFPCPPFFVFSRAPHDNDKTSLHCGSLRARIRSRGPREIPIYSSAPPRAPSSRGLSGSAKARGGRGCEKIWGWVARKKQRERSGTRCWCFGEKLDFRRANS